MVLSKRQRMSSSSSSAFEINSPRLIPSLPDDLSLMIIARLPRICYLNARLVSRKWKATIISSQLYEVRKQLGTTEEWLYLLIKDVAANKLVWYALDSCSQIWQRLPTMPNPNVNAVLDQEQEEIRRRVWVSFLKMEGYRKFDQVNEEKDAFDHEMPLCDRGTGAVNGCLYVLGVFANNNDHNNSTVTSTSVWRFDPIQNTWSKVPNSMCTGRAYSRTCTLNNKLYVVGGIGNIQQGAGIGNIQQGAGRLIFVRSAEVFDPSTDTWSHVPSMPFLKAQGRPYNRLQPIATGLTSYMGRLCVTQCLYNRLIAFNLGGEIYDPETNSWMEMPTGMRVGWPACFSDRRKGVVVDGLLYGFDLSDDSMDSGFIMVYDQGEDAWKVVNGSKLTLFGSPPSKSYLIAAFHGKLHLIANDVNHDIAILQADLHNNSNFDSSLPSNSTPPSPRPLSHEFPGSDHALVWKEVARRGFGQAQLVSCHVIDI